MEETLTEPTLSFFYVVQPSTVVTKSGAVEALAFSVNGHGHIRDVFFSHTLPDHKFVVTDADYTDQGHKWFLAQYTTIFNNPNQYEVFALDLKANTLSKVDHKQFLELQSNWWGKGMGDFRFAVALKTSE